MKTVAEFLTGARARVAKGWTQGSYALDADGRATDPQGENAVCWCTLGALEAEYDTPFLGHHGLYADAIEAIRSDTGYAVARWNDEPDRTKDEVIAMFDRAIELAGKNDQRCDRCSV